MGRGMGTGLVGALVLSFVLAGCGLAPVGGPAVPPGRSCQGVAPDVCQRELVNVQGSRPGQAVVGFHMRCTAAVCDASGGEAEILIAWADGSTETFGTAWAGAAPAAPEPAPPDVALPVVPDCGGVPEPWCREMATAALDGIVEGQVIGITVTCTRSDGCDATVGEGTTVVELADGSEVPSGWGYGS